MLFPLMEISKLVVPVAVMVVLDGLQRTEGRFKSAVSLLAEHYFVQDVLVNSLSYFPE